VVLFRTICSNKRLNQIYGNKEGDTAGFYYYVMCYRICKSTRSRDKTNKSSVSWFYLL